MQVLSYIYGFKRAQNKKQNRTLSNHLEGSQNQSNKSFTAIIKYIFVNLKHT